MQADETYQRRDVPRLAGDQQRQDAPDESVWQRGCGMKSEPTTNARPMAGIVIASVASE
jgi:hypothetical protein